jgi:hypothetical protein
MGPGSTGGASRHGGLVTSRTIGFGAGGPAVLHATTSAGIASIDTSLCIFTDVLLERRLPLRRVGGDLFDHLLGGVGPLVVVSRRLLPRRGLLGLLAAVADERK